MSILKCLQLLLNYSFVPTYFIYFMFTGSWVSVQVQRQINCDFRTTQTCLDLDISLHRCSRDLHPVQFKAALLTSAHFNVLLKSYPHLCKEEPRKWKRCIHLFFLQYAPLPDLIFLLITFVSFLLLLYSLAMKKNILLCFYLPYLTFDVAGVYIYISSPSYNNPA